jgi:hypothetical protein
MSVAHARMVDDARRRSRQPTRCQYDIVSDLGATASAEHEAMELLGTSRVVELLPAPGDVLHAPLRELRQLSRLQPPEPSPELNRLLLTGRPRLRSGQRRRRTILISGAVAVTVATGVTGMAAAHDSPRSDSPAQTTTTSQFDPGDRHQRASVAPRPSPVVPASAPSAPVEPDDDPTPSPPVTQPSAPSRSAAPRRESEAPDDRTRLTSPRPRPSTSLRHRDE